MRFEDVLPDQVRTDLLQPFGLDLRDAAREQARGLDQFRADDPAAGLLHQRRAGMDEVLDAARAEVAAVLLVPQADVAEQPRQQRLVDRLIAGRQLVLPPLVLGAQGVQLAMNVAPFAQAQPGEEFAAAPLALLVGRFVLPDFVRRRPHLQPGQELRAIVLPLGVRLVGRARLFLRPVARILHRQRGRNDQHLLQAAVLPRGEDHATDLRVERQLRHLVADGRQLLAALVDGAQFRKQLVAIGDHARQRRFEEGEVLDVAQMQRLHAQDHAGQR